MKPLDAKIINPRIGGPSFSLRNRIERTLWQFVWRTLGSWTPAPMHGWRRLLLRAFGANIRPTAKVYGGVRVWLPRNLTMDDYACLAPGVDCYCMAPISLGRHALVSQRSFLCAGTHDIDDPNFQLMTRPIRIEANAWVAAEAFVGPGVTIGEGAVLGARGVASRNLDAWTVYAGNPARVLRQRPPRAAARIS